MAEAEETFGARLLREILARFPSRRQFAKAIDMEPAYLTRILKNKVRPEDETIERLAVGLDLPMMEVLSWRIEIGGERRRILLEGDGHAHYRAVPAANTVRLPVVNAIAADEARDGASQLRDEVEVPAWMLEGLTDAVLFRVTGACLAGDNIAPGDLIIVDRGVKDPQQNEIVAVRYNGEDTLKHYCRIGDRIELQPSAQGFNPIHVKDDDELEIIGVYAGMLRRPKRGRR